MKWSINQSSLNQVLSLITYSKQHNLSIVQHNSF